MITPSLPNPVMLAVLSLSALMATVPRAQAAEAPDPRVAMQRVCFEQGKDPVVDSYDLIEPSTSPDYEPQGFPREELDRWSLDRDIQKRKADLRHAVSYGLDGDYVLRKWDSLGKPIPRPTEKCRLEIAIDARPAEVRAKAIKDEKYVFVPYQLLEEKNRLRAARTPQEEIEQIERIEALINDQLKAGSKIRFAVLLSVYGGRNSYLAAITHVQLASILVDRNGESLYSDAKIRAVVRQLVK